MLLIKYVVHPSFYFSLLGSTGAFIFRIINTFDSMVGYKESYFENIGWIAAKADTFTNYIPSRITAIIMIFAVFINKKDRRYSIKHQR